MHPYGDLLGVISYILTTRVALPVHLLVIKIIKQVGFFALVLQ